MLKLKGFQRAMILMARMSISGLMPGIRRVTTNLNFLSHLMKEKPMNLFYRHFVKGFHLKKQSDPA